MLVSQLEDMGISVTLTAGGKVRATPKTAITDEARHLIQSRKPAIILELRQRRPDTSPLSEDDLEDLAEARAEARRIQQEKRAVDPFRVDLFPPPSKARPVPTPTAQWTCPQWQAFTESGVSAVERVARLRMAPKVFRGRIISHVRTVFEIRLSRGTA